MLGEQLFLPGKARESSKYSLHALLQLLFFSLLEHALKYLDHVSKVDYGKNNVEERYQKALVRRVNDILEKVNRNRSNCF